MYKNHLISLIILDFKKEDIPNHELYSSLLLGVQLRKEEYIRGNNKGKQIIREA